MRRIFAARNFHRIEHPDMGVAAGDGLGDELVCAVPPGTLAPVVAQALEVFGNLFLRDDRLFKRKVAEAADKRQSVGKFQRGFCLRGLVLAFRASLALDQLKDDRGIAA